MIDVPLSGNSEWRNTLKTLSLPLSVENDPLLVECLESITSGGYVDVQQGVKLFESSNISSRMSDASEFELIITVRQVYCFLSFSFSI